MAKHYPANTVLSPRDCVDKVTVIFDGGATQGGFSVAIVEWQGIQRIGIRWNITERELNNPDKVSGKIICVGEPNSRGYATWFILPDAFLRSLFSGSDIATAVMDYLNTKE